MRKVIRALTAIADLHHWGFGDSRLGLQMRKNAGTTWRHSLPKSAVIIFGIAMINFGASIVSSYRAEQRLQAEGFTLSGSDPLATVPMLLIVSALCLLGNRFWLLLISISVALRALYLLSYRQWRDLARNAFELPMFSWLTAEKTLNFYLERPPIILQLFLAIAIVVCGFVLVRSILSERRERLLAGG